MRPPGHRNGAVGGAEAALQAVLGEDDRHPPLFVQPAQEADELVARDRIELRRGLVEQHQLRAPDQRGRERDTLELPAGEGVHGPIEQLGHRQGEGNLLHGPRPRGRRLAADLERELQLGAHRGRDDLGLRVLGHEAHGAAELRRAVVADV